MEEEEKKKKKEKKKEFRLDLNDSGVHLYWRKQRG